MDELSDELSNKKSADNKIEGEANRNLVVYYLFVKRLTNFV